MKAYTGSLQKRGRRYYLVIHKNGGQRWLALKTDRLSVARARAASLAPRDPDGELAWLEQLVREGERARDRLSRLRAERGITWDNIDARAAGVIDIDASEDNREGHARWMTKLIRMATRTASGGSPGLLNAADAHSVVGELYRKCRSASRMVAYYRRVWEVLDLDAGVWAGCGTVSRSATASEHYRRLSLDEVRKVLKECRRRRTPLADMIRIGYSTGLRLSDVAQLEQAEVCLPFLRVCPNKTRRSKPLPLKIPLTTAAQAVVRRLQATAAASNERYLFAERDRKRPSRKIARMFRAAGVGKIATGRASFHSLRATFISLMDDAGISPHLTDSITGHGGGGMHARYSQPSDAALLAAVARAIPDLE